ncbi:MAG: hypothetical protein A2Y40_00865 [Candidatus Margulisbacteria bacterium GWF2_35_9]|nr:MAG: hypothetical protein A2Y40_00865 [Candidatus Margulisbacteria bacterium GWF2_35_9]
MILKNRKPTRKQGYDYSTPGYYFITTNVKDRLPWFGEIKNDQMVLNEYGAIASHLWEEIPHHFRDITLDEFIIMPDHVHGIIIIDAVGNNDRCSLQPSRNMELIPKIISQYKSSVTRKIRETYHDHEFQWQSSFHDRIIRDEPELGHIRQYIWDNPKKTASS